jgi:hypothetical protein
VALNALSTSIILHVAIGRRWPFLRHHEEVHQTTQPPARHRSINESQA